MPVYVRYSHPSVRSVIDVHTMFGILNSQTVDCKDLDTVADKCAYIKQCFTPIGLNYLEFYYCSHQNIAILLISSSLILSFICIGKVASDHLSPNLHYISKFLKLSDNVAGLTLLALGNCSPDILSTYRAMSLGEANLAVSELIGSSFLITTIVIGMISIIHPFHLPRKVFIRDSGFLFSICIVIFISLCNGYISIGTSMLLIICYVIYVTYIITNHHILRESTIKNLREERIRNTFNNAVVVADIDLPTIDEINLHNINEYDEEFQRELETEYDEFRRFNVDDINVTANSYGVKQLIRELTNHNRSEIVLTHDHPLSSIQLIDDIESSYDHLGLSEFDQNSFDHYDIRPLLNIFKVSKFYQLPTYPLTILISLTIPESVDFVKLIFTTLYLNFKLYSGVTNLIFIHLPITLILLALIHKYPYQIIYSTLGFIVSITWISTFANEIINCLKCVSVIFDLSDEILGFTIFAIGNSIGDLIANFTIARMGMPIMAFAACFGSPILSLTSLGINTLIILANNENYSKTYISDFGYLINSSRSLIILSLGGIINLLLLMGLSWKNDWFIDKRIGIVLVCNWALVSAICIILEINK